MYLKIYVHLNFLFLSTFDCLISIFQESVEPEAEEVSETPTLDISESEKRGHEDDAEVSEANEPATKKFKPEEPEAIATAVVWNHATSIDKKLNRRSDWEEFE